MCCKITREPEKRNMIPELIRKSYIAAAVICAFAAFGGCRSPEETGHRLTIGVSYQDLQNEFIIKLQDAIRAKAKELNIQLIELDAQGKAENQISHIENFVARDVDAIILNPADKEGSSPAVDIAVREHKPVVVVNSIVSNLQKANAFVGSPDVEAGHIEVAEIMRLLHNQGNIALIQGPYGHSAEVQRTKGIRELLATFPGARIVAEQTANWSRATAMSVMENMLSSGRKIDAVIAENDEMALGASKAIEGAGKQKDIPVIGIDAIADALKAVAAGKMAGTVFQDAHQQGTLSVELAYRLIKGERVEHTNYIPFQLVTKENVGKFLK